MVQRSLQSFSEFDLGLLQSVSRGDRAESQGSLCAIPAVTQSPFCEQQRLVGLPHVDRDGAATHEDVGDQLTGLDGLGEVERLDRPFLGQPMLPRILVEPADQLGALGSET